MRSSAGLNGRLQQAFWGQECANVNNVVALPPERWTPPLLIMACAGGHLEIVQCLLLEQRVDVNATRDIMDNTALHMAVRRNHVHIVRFLLQLQQHDKGGRAVQVNAFNSRGSTPLHVACQGNNPECVELLLQHGAHAWAVNSQGKNCLDLAIGQGCDDIIELLAKQALPQTDKPVFCILGSLLHRLYDMHHTSTMFALLDRYPSIVDHVQEEKTVLHRACEGGQIDVIRRLFLHGANVNITSHENQSTLLHEMCCQKRPCRNVVELLLNHGASIDAANSDGNTPLHVTIGKLEILKLLLCHGALVNQQNKKGQTALALAAAKGKLDDVSILIQYGAQVDCVDDNDETPLFYCCRENHPELVRYLVSEARANLHRVNRDGWTPLHVACFHQNLRIAEMLVQCDAVVHGGKGWKTTPLHLACQVGTKAKVLSRLMRSCAELRFSRNGHMTTLHATYRANNVQLIDILLNHGASINGVDKDETTPLHHACLATSLDLVQVLLQRGAEINSISKDGRTPLHMACRTFKISTLEIVKLLVKEGASIHVQDMKGMTCLHHACDYSCLEVVEFLIQCGAEVNKTSIDNWTPLHHACRRCNIAVVRVLLEQGVPVDTPTKQGETALHVACKRWSWDVVKLLLERGANVNHVSLNGQTALHHVVGTGSQTTVRLLMQHGANLDVRDKRGVPPLLMGHRDVNMLYILLREHNALSSLL